MPPAVRIEAKAWDDPAFAVLAMRLGWQDADLAIIKCARIWAHATEQNDPTIPAVEVDAIVRTPGFALHMVAARLADVSDKNSEAIVLRGATGKNRNRISWLATKRKNSRKGGSANGAKWGAKGEPIGSGSAVPKGSPNTPAPAPAPARSEKDLVAVGDQPALLVVPPVAGHSEPQKPRKQPTGDHAEFIRAWDALYAEKTGGRKATWDGKSGAAVKALLERHGLPECITRATRLFKSPPKWLADDVPTIGTFRVNFDALAVAVDVPPVRAYNGRG